MGNESATAKHGGGHRKRRKGGEVFEFGPLARFTIVHVPRVPPIIDFAEDGATLPCVRWGVGIRGGETEEESDKEVYAPERGTERRGASKRWRSSHS